MIKQLTLWAALWLFFPVFLQAQDTLLNKGYGYLAEKIDSTKDSIKATTYAGAYVAKAKAEHNWEEQVAGYKYFVHLSEARLRFAYADSMVYAAQKSKQNDVIGAAYLTRGIVFYAEKQHIKALDNYLIANNFIAKTNDDYLKYKVKYFIAHIKYYLGFYDEAMALFKECLPYFKDTDDRGYLNALHSLALCYNRTGNYSLCTQTNNLGLAESSRLNITEMSLYYKQCEGVNQYFEKNYKTALKMLLGVMAKIEQQDDFGNVSVTNFYIAKCYIALNSMQKALPYLRRVDEIFNAKAYIRPDLRENYEILINYYKDAGIPELQLHYIGQLLKADSILNANYKYLSGKIHKEYDTKELLYDKKKIEVALDNRKALDVVFIGLIVVLFFAVVYLMYRHFKNLKKYRQKFTELMNPAGGGNEPVTKQKTENLLDINPDVVNAVLDNLAQFEKEHKFLDKDLTQVKLAALIDSNTKYTSKIILHYKNKKYIDYINDLRIDYIVGRLKTAPHFRNYTYKALAEEAGFSTTQHFASAFVNRTGLTHSYFIEQLKKEVAVPEMDTLTTANKT
ncbi:AraC family transcriptional regulator [Flavobacterium subsaxonicum]|uniref:AraC family transcriptional regulator n=1 Tax=Flavobacterium subsaxonicum TaxID=426226 RepID=UPI0003FE2569|nr:AraC family transcriptional regulator [Flavobacterium subsaxonicum]